MEEKERCGILSRKHRGFDRMMVGGKVGEREMKVTRRVRENENKGVRDRGVK